MHYILAIFFIWNLSTFFLMFADKRRARLNRYRIPERTLLTAAFLMGGTGAYLGSIVFRHKTKHLKFKILLPLFAVINIAVLIFVMYYYSCAH